MKFFKWMMVALTALALVSCGGGGGSGGSSLFSSGGTSGSTSVTEAAVLVLDLGGVTSITNSGSDTLTATAVTKDANNVVLKDVKVSFAVDSGSVTALSDKTNAEGKATATISVGDVRSNRVITVTATSGTLTQTKTFKVTGSKIKSTAVPSVVTPGGAGEVQYQVVDVNGNPMVNQDIAISSAVGSASGKTDTNGVFAFAYTGPASAGQLVITATAAGVSQTDSITVQALSGGTLPNVTPGSIQSGYVEGNPSVVTVNEVGSTTNRSAIRALFTGPNNARIANVRVRFDLNGDANSVGGTFSSGTSLVYSDINGEASTFYIPATKSSPTDGVTVRACYGYNDAEMANGACPRQTTVALTVVSGAISVSIGTDGKLIDVNGGLQLAQDFVVTVNDTAGRAKGGVDVVPSVDLVSFGKGQFSYLTMWTLNAPQYFYQYFTSTVPNPTDPTKTITVTTRADIADGASNGGCWNEDRNRNGVLEAVEDDATIAYSKSQGGNGNNSLDPRKSNVLVTVNGGVTGKTDASGSVVVRITYARNLAGWVKYNLLVAAGGIGGTEGRSNWLDVLGIPLSDLKNEATPAFIRSPYGVLAGCNNAN